MLRDTENTIADYSDFDITENAFNIPKIKTEI